MNEYGPPITALTKEQIDAETRQHKHAERTFIGSLPPANRRLYRTGVVASRDGASRSNELDYAAIQRLIFASVVRLGWRPELFAKYDESLRHSPEGDTPKVERIGKKYQWIAFHETLARVADNFCFRGDALGSITPFMGPWQVGERDLDPSCLLQRPPEDEGAASAWWAPQYRSWQPNLGHTTWAQRTADLPDQAKLLQVRRRHGWLVLDGFYRWQQPTPPGEERFAFDTTQRDLWYIVRSYLVRQADALTTFAWAKQQDFMGRWMPDPLETQHVFLREFPRAPAYRDQHDRKNRRRWKTVEGLKGPGGSIPLLSTTETYVWEGGTDGSLRIRVPAHEVVKGLRMTHGVIPGTFVDKVGTTIAQDPSLHEPGPEALLVKRESFLQFLRREKLALLWVVSGEKRLLGLMKQRGFPGRLEMGGAFRMTADGKIDGKTYAKWWPPDVR
jgi:hypothetical protein